MKRLIGFVNVFGSDEQLGAADSRVHAACVVRSKHGFDPDLIQNALRYCSIRR